MDRQRIHAGLIICLVVIASCTRDTTLDKKFVDTYTSVLITRESYKDSTEARSAVRDTLRAHGMNNEEFESTLRSIADDPDRYRTLLDSVASELKRRK